MDNNIRIARINSGLSQKEVAITLHVSAPSVSDWESGKKTPTSDNICKLADLFGVSTDYLLGRDITPIGASIAPRQSPSITPAEGELLSAYRAAPQPIRDIVDTALAPYANKNPTASENAAG
ncbi:MAG: helix-turn-helix transcriptional regulator [Clostridiales bacterium]|nr:helix-turn-helix transcriptional regulator [Candidatus Cacconaster stercorequi]